MAGYELCCICTNTGRLPAYLLSREALMNPIILVLLFITGIIINLEVACASQNS